MKILAIDPGQKGGLAWLDVFDRPCCKGMPDTHGDLLALLRRIREVVDTCYIEHVVGFIPGGGAGAMFSFGVNFGYLQGCLDSLSFRVIRVRPQAWQKALQLGGKVGKVKADADASKDSKKAVGQINRAANKDWKNKLKADAQRRFPGMHITLETADACLLLDYARITEATK